MYEFDNERASQLLSKLLTDSSKELLAKHPLMILCSKYMHMFPWELILPLDPLVRCSVLGEHLEAEQQRVRHSEYYGEGWVA